MLIDIVNAEDKVIGTVDRQDVLTQAVNFRVAHVFVFNAAGLLLLPQIPQGKRHAGLWGSSVAGFVHSGETYGQAAARRLAKELGICKEPRFCLRTSLNEESGAVKFIHLFETTYDGPVKFNQ